MSDPVWCYRCEKEFDGEEYDKECPYCGMVDETERM